MAKEFRAAADLMVAVAQRAGGIGRDQPGERRLAVFERRPGQVVAVEMEQVEREEHQGIGALVGDRILQMAEIGRAIRFEMDELAVDQRRGDRQFAETCAASAGNFAVQSRPLRVNSRTLPSPIRPSSR